MNLRKFGAALLAATLFIMPGPQGVFAAPLPIIGNTTTPGGQPLQQVPVQIVNPNDGTPCIIGNTGCPSIGGGSGGGGAVTGAVGSFLDGWSITDGQKVDAPCANSSATCSAIAIQKGLLAAAQDTTPVAVSASALPLPTGAATAAKQPALGTAGTASSDVLTVQGVASMTALKVDGSAVTQPVSSATLATAALQPTNAAQGAAIASATGNMVQCSVTTSPVTYVTATINPINCATSGGVRVEGGTIGTAAPVPVVIVSSTATSAANLTPSVSTSGAATSLVVKGTGAIVYDGYCHSTVAGNCILYNATSPPGAGALTAALVLECKGVVANGEGGWNYNTVGRRASIGYTILFSSSTDCNTYTVSNTAYIHGTAP